MDYETADAAAEEGKRRREGEEEPARKVGVGRASAGAARAVHCLAWCYLSGAGRVLPPLLSPSATCPLPFHRTFATLQPKAARQVGPLPEIQVGAAEAVAEGVTRQKVLQPHRKAMELSSMVDISQVIERVLLAWGCC